MAPESYAERVERDGSSLSDLAGRATAGSVGLVVEMLGDEHVHSMPTVSAPDIQDALGAYFAECEEADGYDIAAVGLQVNNYRKDLGLGLLSVRVVPLDAEGDEVRGDLDVESPTVGFVLEGDALCRATFETGRSGEVVTSFTEGLALRDSSPDAQSADPVMSHGDTFNASTSVDVELPVADLSQLATTQVDWEPLPEAAPTSGGVYFCRYFVR